MLVIRRFDISVWPLNGWRLSWLIQSAPQTSVIHIDRADAAAGPWTRVATGLPPTTIFFEDQLGSRGMWNRSYWRLILADGVTDAKLLESIPMTWDSRVDRYVAEVVRAHEMKLISFNKQFNGWVRHFAVYRQITYGDMCPTCVNPVTNKTFLDKCPTCLGSRVIQGWSNPVYLPGYFKAPFQRTTVTGEFGKSQEMRNTLCTTTRVLLDPGDFLAERHSGRVWRVADITTTQPGDQVTTQNAEVEAVERDRIESTLAFPEALLDG